jgi:hypothetical protein
MANIVVSALATFNGKALKKGKKEISLFDQQVQKLGKTFASVFAAQKLFQFSKKAVSAFMADEKAAKSLEVQLKNTGFQFSAPGVENYIGKLQRLSGVLDDELRPAFQQLLTATGSITRSQDALQTALNISAATGKSLSEVSAALTRGFSGNTTGLSRLGAGISKATLKTGDMDKIMGELNKKFAGQAAARLDTYAGKMGLLSVAAADAQETIGKGLLDALALLGKDTSISTATDLMDNFAQSTADAILGVGVLISKLKEIGNTKVGGALFDVKNIPVLGAYLAGFSEIGAAQRSKTAPSNAEGRSSSRIYLQQLRLESKASKDLTNAKKAETAATKAKSEVDKLKDKFDIERIGLTLALNQATDTETKLRLQAQLAILDNNEAMAKKLNIDLDAAAKAKALSDALAKAALAADSFSNFAMGAVQRGEYADAYKNISNVPTQSAGGAMQLPSAATFAMGGVSRGEYAPVTVNVAGSVLTEQDLTNTINETLLRINKMGRGTTPAGGLSGGT